MQVRGEFSHMGCPWAVRAAVRPLRSEPERTAAPRASGGGDIANGPQLLALSLTTSVWLFSFHTAARGRRRSLRTRLRLQVITSLSINIYNEGTVPVFQKPACNSSGCMHHSYVPSTAHATLSYLRGAVLTTVKIYFTYSAALLPSPRFACKLSEHFSLNNYCTL